MALKKTITTEHGFVVNDAYHRIENLMFQNKNEIQFSIKTYVSLDKSPILSTMRSCPYDLNGANPFVQVYEYLKTTDEFKDAEDC